MNAIDIALLALLGVLVILGAMKGMTRILLGIGAFVAAFALAARFHERVAALVPGELPAGARELIAYAAIFFGTLLAGGVLAWLARKLLAVAMLSWADRLAGGALGLVAALLVGALALLPVVAYSQRGQQALEDSMLAPYVTVVADVANRWMPEKLAEQYRRGIATLREHWRERLSERAAGLRA